MKLIARIYDCANKNIRPRALKYQCANLNTHTVTCHDDIDVASVDAVLKIQIPFSNLESGPSNFCSKCIAKTIRNLNNYLYWQLNMLVYTLIAESFT